MGSSEVLWEPCADYRVHRLINHAKSSFGGTISPEKSFFLAIFCFLELSRDLLGDWSFIVQTKKQNLLQNEKKKYNLVAVFWSTENFHFLPSPKKKHHQILLLNYILCCYLVSAKRLAHWELDSAWSHRLGAWEMCSIRMLMMGKKSELNFWDFYLIYFWRYFVIIGVGDCLEVGSHLKF